jgi:hypothetical protein
MMRFREAGNDRPPFSGHWFGAVRQSAQTRHYYRV